jgi:branched-chain amino acid transport system substrate-binding protein
MLRQTGWARPALTALAALLALTPCGVRAADPFEIPVIVSLTGQLAFLGKEQSAALGVAESLVNKAGGVRGRAIKFVVYDDQTNPQVAVQLLNQIAAKKPVVVLGSSSTAACNAMEPLLKDGPVAYCFTPGAHPAAGSYLFSTSLSSADLVAASLRYFRETGVRKIAILASTDAGGQDGERGVVERLADPENRELSIVAREHFNTTDITVAAQIARIKASGADALVAWTTGSPFGTVVRATVEGGLSIPMMTSSGNLSYAQLESYGDFMSDNVLFPGNPGDAPDAVPNGRVKNAAIAFVNAMKAAGIRADQGHTLAWDPALIVVDALRKIGLDATPLQLRDYLMNLRGWDGINGTYDFRAIPQRGVGIGSVIMVRWIKAKDNWIGVSKPGGSPRK